MKLDLHVYTNPIHPDAVGMIGTLEHTRGWETTRFTDITGGTCIQVIPGEDTRPLHWSDRIAMPPPYQPGDLLDYKHPALVIPVTFVEDDEGWAKVQGADQSTVSVRYSRLTRRNKWVWHGKVVTLSADGEHAWVHAHSGCYAGHHLTFSINALFNIDGITLT